MGRTRYRYDKRIEVLAWNFSDAKRQIEARINGPINVFRLEALYHGNFVPAC